MRVIKFVAVLLVAISIVFPKAASASELGLNNEEIKSTFSKILSLVSPSSALAKEIPVDKNDEKTETEPVKEKKVKSEEETKRKEILDKWKKKQVDKWKNLPEGKFKINASAYTAAADDCDKSDGVTASGLKVKENRTIACPKEFPFGL